MRQLHVLTALFMKSLLKMFGGVAIVLSTVSCNRPPEAPAPEVPPSASAAVTQFFQGYRGDYRQADQTFLSQALAAALQSAVEGEKESAARIKASEFPTDKPLLLEGEIFTGLYEGFTGFEVGPEGVKDGQTVVEVRFRNEPYNVTWTDEVVLVDEGGWKIDDVRYSGKKAGLLGLRDVLRDFESSLTAEASATPPPL